MKVETISGKIARYENLREQAEAVKAELDALNKQKDEAEAEVITAILDEQEASGVEALRIGYEGRNYSVAVKQYYGIPAASKDSVLECMRDLNMGDLIQERVDDRTLTKELESVMEENGGDFPEEYSTLVERLRCYSRSTLRRVKA